MAAIDIGKAATAGFRVIGRSPMAVLAWALVLLVVGVLPAAGLISAFLGALAEMVEAEAAGREAAPEDIMPMMSAMFAMQPVILVTGIIVRALLTSAIFRAVLEPSERRWFYLRLGAQELWMALMIAVMWVLMSLLSFPAVFLIMPIVMFAVASAPDNPAMIVGPTAIVVLVIAALYVWLLIRFSMALPMTFAQRKFRLFESWTMTRGRTGQLFGVGVIVVAMVLLLELLVAAVFVAVSFSLHGAGGLDEAAIAAFFAQDASIWMAELAPWAIGVAVLGAVIGAVMSTVVTAPWAEVYRQLKGAGGEPSA